ncbi:membrane anchor subunit of succinate dehydrogenase, Sdh4 [Entomophthora muscae]|uniref:Membrane anchor subunit of succinate dehydrogenase, Sdh4 n=1 Tax=Entomophthora muscae TaxID=34485 RepID=A0ACC2ULQ2_9FUNG|nr:membrane anchor subunit of succinate dehydrogenase, Sdh4 [Entomophthora muscae]
MSKLFNFSKTRFPKSGLTNFTSRTQTWSSQNTLKPQFLFLRTSNSQAGEVTKASKMEGSYHWYFEKAVSVALIPVLGGGLLFDSNKTNDYALGVLLPVHIHMGLSSVIEDYLPFRRVPTLNTFVLLLQHISTLCAMFGCYFITSTDVGLTKYLKNIWTA